MVRGLAALVTHVFYKSQNYIKESPMIKMKKLNKPTIAGIIFLLSATLFSAGFKGVQKDFYIEKGADFNPILAWEDSDGVRIDLTGADARMMIRQTPTSPTYSISCTTANGRIGIQTTSIKTSNVPSGSVTGSVLIDINKVDTMAITINGGVYDLFVDFAGGDTWRLLYGNIKLSEAITY